MDITAHGVAALLATTIGAEIEQISLEPAKHSWRVSPSSLGEECVAKQWYKFRWAKLGSFSGRMARLFKRGHAEEEKLTALLRSTGWVIHDIDPAKADRKDFNQFRMKEFEGHLSGYLDGIGMHPVHTGGAWVLMEYKTFNAKRFAAWRNKKLKISDPKYYVQTCLYMKAYNLPWCLVVGINKDDDDVQFEVVPRDDATADKYLRTAHTIIFSKARPARIAQSSAFHLCKHCTFVEICHNKAPVDISCRSCQHCIPAVKGAFYCGHWQADIPNREAIEAACPQHLPIV